MDKIASLAVAGWLAVAIGPAVIPARAQQPKFDVADVNVSKTPRWFVGNYVQNNAGRLRDGRYILRDANMLNLIGEAYSVTEDQIAGGPTWMRLDIYDVIARAPGGATPAAAKLMLRGLLAERFGLVARQDTHPVPRFVLGVGKGGSKLKPAAATTDSGCRQGMAGTPPGPGLAITPALLPNVKVTCRNVTITDFVENLRPMAGGPINTYLTRDVIDSTGLTGKWDFELEFTPIGIVGDKGRDGITLYDAVSKQPGLTLELKDVPLPALVVESVNRKPTPNSPNAANELGGTDARFEVASIKPVNPGERILPRAAGSEMRFVGTLRSLITQAYMITPDSANDEIVNLPKSADSLVWDITAKLPGSGEGAPMSGGARPLPPLRSVVMEMLRSLLAERFELKTHTENREATVYAMILPAKPKMTPGNPAERSECHVDPTAVKPFPNMGTMVTCRNFMMSDFAEDLNQATGFFDHPIVDATGSKSGWNFSIGWSANRPPLPTTNQTADAAEPTGLTSYEAVERLTGLKLVKQRRSIPLIVVDHAADKPIE